MSAGEEAVRSLAAVVATSETPSQKVHALWALERLGALGGEMLERAAGALDREVRVHVQRILAERSEWTREDRYLVLRALADEDAFVKRAAAEALGLHPNPENLGPLLGLRARIPAEDTHLLHAVRVALRNQLRLPGSWWYVELLEFPAAWLADVGLGVPEPHAAEHLLAFLRQHGADRGEAEEPARRQVSAAVRHVARYATPAVLEELHAWLTTSSGWDAGERFRILSALQRGTSERGGKLEGRTLEWAAKGVRSFLEAGEERELLWGLRLIGELGLPGHEERVARLASQHSASDAT